MHSQRRSTGATSYTRAVSVASQVAERLPSGAAAPSCSGSSLAVPAASTASGDTARRQGITAAISNRAPPDLPYAALAAHTDSPPALDAAASFHPRGVPVRELDQVTTTARLRRSRVIASAQSTARDSTLPNPAPNPVAARIPAPYPSPVPRLDGKLHSRRKRLLSQHRIVLACSDAGELSRLDYQSGHHREPLMSVVPVRRT